jgi:DNA repair photolyase
MHPLPVLSARQQTSQDAEAPLFQLLPPTLAIVQRVQDRQRLLRCGPFPHQPDILAVEHLQGCVHRCGFCTARSSGRDVIRMVADAAVRVSEELLELPRLPRAVFISPNSDPFPPINEIQAETVRLVEVLAQEGIDSLLMTRGYIRPAAKAVLAAHAKRVKVTVALMTMDRSLQRMLEPLTASPSLRLRMLRDLRRAGIACQVALEPLIPGVTDTRENLLPLLEALADADVRHVTVGYLFLRGRIEQTLQELLEPHGLDGLALDEFEGAPVLSGRANATRYLPRGRRQHGYAAVMALAAGFGISVGINPLSNPDFTPGPRIS